MKDIKQKRDPIAYLFLIPSMLGVLLFSLGPLVLSLFISLTDWNFTKGFANWNFVWFENFKTLFADTWFVDSLLNTLTISLVTVPVGLIISIIIAALIDNFCRKRLANVLRVGMYMPHIANIVASSAVWMALFSSYGPFTQLVRTLGWIDPPKWLADYTWALPALMLVMVWSGLGYRIFIYSSSIAGISKELYESADLDGASGVGKFIHITVPQLRPTTLFLTITGIISSFKVFGYTNIMTRGGPGSSTYTLVYYIYTSAFKYYKFGYASAIAMILFLILLVITMIQWRSSNNLG